MCNEKTVSIVPEVRALELLYDRFNEEFFESALSRPVITFNTDITKGAYGWWTTDTVWYHSTDGKRHEINICCDAVESPQQIAKTLLHEMCHQFNFDRGIKDCSRGGTYHNTKFRDCANSHGLVCTQGAKYGWHVCELTERALITAEPYFEDFTLKRDKAKAKTVRKARSSTRKYVCPCCGLSVRATKEVRVLCADCSVELELDF